MEPLDRIEGFMDGKKLCRLYVPRAGTVLCGACFHAPECHGVARAVRP